MSTEIAIRSLSDKIVLAEKLAVSTLLPDAYRKQPGNLLFAIEYAEALGVSPIHAITSIHVISGKPSASADLIAALIRRAGHKLRVIEGTDLCTAQIIRADDPDFTFAATFTMADARAAKLTGNPSWTKFPRAMLRSRAITEVARQAASDALFGVVYTPEELGAEVDDQGNVVDAAPEPARQVESPHQQPPRQARPSNTRSGMGALREATAPPAAPEWPPADDMIAQAMGSESRDELRAMWDAAEGHPEVARIREMVEARVAELPIDAEIIPDEPAA